ncbi:MAG: nucleotide exchange factor GrpE [Prevotellaceae bacterium]|jgi:molecular chaperone GrpE|nr:nucleotide exchange factor GrpE [Prevotellaceae bacterium]
MINRKKQKKMEKDRKEVIEQEEVSVNITEPETGKEPDENGVPENSEGDREKELTEKLAEVQDRYLRLSAEFDNYRKRTLKERYELVKTAGEDILKDLLPVIDDFDRAMEVMSSSDSIEAILEGTKLIYSKFKSILENRGLVAINPFGEDFDPDIHEAIAKIKGPDGQEGKIIDVTQKGYSLNEKIIRHPKVVVGE